MMCNYVEDKIIIGEKSVSEWECSWKCIGILDKINLSQYNDSIGIIKCVLDGEIKYIGKATEINNGGFRKRLSDFVRKSESGRKHKAGRLINQNQDKVIIYIIDVGKDEKSKKSAEKLKKAFLSKYSPEWNR